MQTVDAVWDRLLEDPTHWVDTKVTIAGVDYENDSLSSLRTAASIFTGDKPQIGGCCIREIDLVIREPSIEIPRQAKIEPWVRLSNGQELSQWIPKGKFYIDVREDEEPGNLAIHGFCDLRRAETDCPIDGLDWPASDIIVVTRIARQIGVELDPRTVAAISRGYQVQMPADYSSREVLAGIAAMYGGSFIMSDEGKLLLVRPHMIPKATNYLVTENGAAITFGGVRILV